MKEYVKAIVKKESRTFLLYFSKKSKFVKNGCIETISPLQILYEKLLHFGKIYNFGITSRKVGSNYVICANYQESTTRNTEMAHNFTKKLNSHIKSIGKP